MVKEFDFRIQRLPLLKNPNSGMMFFTSEHDGMRHNKQIYHWAVPFEQVTLGFWIWKTRTCCHCGEQARGPSEVGMIPIVGETELQGCRKQVLLDLKTLIVVTIGQVGEGFLESNWPKPRGKTVITATGDDIESRIILVRLSK